MTKFSIAKILTAVGADYIPTGAHWKKMRCIFPEHPDAIPSAAVHHAWGRYSCMACNFNGDALDVIMHVEGIPVAVAKLRCQEICLDGGDEVPTVRKGKRTISDGLF